MFELCSKVSQKTQITMSVSVDYYKQAHLQQSGLSSMALGVLTSSIFQLCDLNNLNNFLVKFSNERMERAQEIKQTNMLVKLIRKRFDARKACLESTNDKNGEIALQLDDLKREVDDLVETLLNKQELS